MSSKEIDVGSIFECSLCYESFDMVENRPKLLPCGHTFCLACVKRIAEKGGALATCPEDRETVNLTKPTELKDNRFIVSWIQEIKTRQLQNGNSAEAGSEGSKVTPRLLLRQVAGAVMACEGQGSEAELELLHCQEAVSLTAGSWSAVAVQLQQQPALRLAMLLLQQQGQLQRRKNKQQQQQQQQQGPQEQRGRSSSSVTAASADVNVCELSLAGPSQRNLEKAALLRRTLPVHVLRRVMCHRDPAWAQALLTRHAATLRELHLYSARREHLQLLRDMPALLKLEVQSVEGLLPADPDRHGAQGGRGVQWLQAGSLPRAALRWLLLAFHPSLLDLDVRAGAPPATGEPECWPLSCGDLPALLRDCGIVRLRTLLLRRSLGSRHAGCPAQRDAVAAALPGVKVTCSQCGLSSAA